MRLFPIHQAGYHGRHIKVDRYATSANGVEISISHNLPNVAGSQFQWVQTVSSNGGFSVDCKMLTRVDPFGHGSPSLHKVSLPAVPGLCKADECRACARPTICCRSTGRRPTWPVAQARG